MNIIRLNHSICKIIGSETSLWAGLSVGQSIVLSFTISSKSGKVDFNAPFRTLYQSAHLNPSNDLTFLCSKYMLLFFPFLPYLKTSLYGKTTLSSWTGTPSSPAMAKSERPTCWMNGVPVANLEPRLTNLIKKWEVRAQWIIIINYLPENFV